MPNSDEVLTVELRLKDFISKNLDKIKKEFRETAAAAKKQFGGINKAISGAKKGIIDFAKRFGPAAIAASVLTAAMVAFGRAVRFVNEVTETFEKTMSRVEAILRPTIEEMGALAARARELGESTIFTASQVGDAFVEMGKLGQKANEIIDASAGVLDLAAIAQVNMARAAEVTVGTLNQFGLAANESGRVVDVMASAFNSGALDIDKISASLKFAGPIAGQTGVSLEEMASVLEVMADNMVDASIAGTSMRTILIGLADAGSKANKHIAKLDPSAKTLTEKFIALKKSGADITTMVEIFNKRAATAALVLTKNIEGADKLRVSFINAGGTAKEFAAIMLDNVAGDSIKLKSAQEALGISIGEAFSESKRERIQLYTKTIKGASKWVKRHQDDLRTLGIVLTETVRGLIWMGTVIFKVVIFAWNTLKTVIAKVLQEVLNAVLLVLKGLNKLGKVLHFSQIDVGGLQFVVDELGKSAEQSFGNAALALLGFDVLLKQTKNTTEELIDDTDELAGKEKTKILTLQEQLALKLAQIQVDKEAILIATERINQIKIEEQAFALLNDTRIASIRDTNERELEELNAFFDKKVAATKNNADAIAAIESARIIATSKLEQEQHIERLDRMADMTSKTAATLTKITNLVLSSEKGRANAAKAIALVEAAINTAVAVTKAIATAGSNTERVIAGLAAGVTGAAEIATIAAASFGRGGDFVTNGPQLIQVGDNPGGREHVSITPTSSSNFNGPSGGQGPVTIGDTNININGNVGPSEVDQIDSILRERERRIELLFRNNRINPSRLGLQRAVVQ